MLDALSIERNIGINKVRDYWTSLGIDHFLYELENLICVRELRVPKDKRGCGIGTLAMQYLIEYADSVGKRAVLSPSKDFGASSLPRLQKFYRRFGFVANKGKHKDYEISDTMYREPILTPNESHSMPRRQKIR